MRQVLLAASLGLIVTLFGTPVAIRVLVRRGYGQLIRDDGPTSHHTKRGTPTMGGTVIILATLVGYLVGHLVTLRCFTASALLAMHFKNAAGLTPASVKISFVRDVAFLGIGMSSFGFVIWAILMIA